MTPLEKRLGKRIAAYRRQAGLTQAQVARKVRVAPETLSRLETGAAMASLPSVEKVAHAIGVELADLFAFRGRDTEKNEAIERLVSVVRTRKVHDIEMITALAATFFRHSK
jgi:transcriptional regulator with XRE-family HTH domain